MIDVTSLKKIMTSSNGLCKTLLILCLICQASSQKDDTSKQPITQTDNADKRFDSNPLAGLPGSENETPEDLPSLNRVKKVTESKSLQPIFDNQNTRQERKDSDESTPGFFYIGNRQQVQNYKTPEQQARNPVPVQKIADFAIFREDVEKKILRHKRNDQDESSETYNSGIQYSAYGEAGTGRSAGGLPTRPPKPKAAKKSGPALTSTTSRPAEYAPQIDENFVSTLFKNPEAVKMVFDYLEEKKAFTTTTKAPRQTPQPTSESKIPSLASTFTSAPVLQPPKKPVSANQASLNRLSSFFGHALLSQSGENNKNNDKKKNDIEVNRGQTEAPQRPETKRPDQKRPVNKIPSLASIFGAFEQPPPKRPENVNNPLMTGEQKPDFQFFGPSDFVPKSQYSLPIHTNGPMRLKYISAADFPYNTKFGIVPIPR